MLVRLSTGFCERQEFWQTIFADDNKLAAQGPERFDNIVLVILLWTIFGCPFSWKKTRGGLTTEWLGYWLDYARFEIGLTEKRAAWLVNWITESLNAQKVPIPSLQEGLGRLHVNDISLGEVAVLVSTRSLRGGRRSSG